MQNYLYDCKGQQWGPEYLLWTVIVLFIEYILLVIITVKMQMALEVYNLDCI
jgi:hypothetical protein